MKTSFNQLTDTEIDALLRTPIPPASAGFEQRLQDSIQKASSRPARQPRSAIIRLFSASLAAAAAVTVFLILSPTPTQTAPETAVIEEELFVLCDYLAGIDPETFEDITYYVSLL